MGGMGKTTGAGETMRVGDSAAGAYGSSRGGGTATRTPTTTTPGVGASPTPISKEFEADKPNKMPVYNSPSQLESAKRKRQAIMARSGRTSTNLTGNPGTRPFQNSFLGSIQ